MTRRWTPERLRASILVVCAILLGLAGCDTREDYTTHLTATRGLKAGDPVIHQGRRIGTVNEIRSLPEGDSEVAFAVDNRYALEVQQDTAAVVTVENGAPALKLFATTKMASRPAPPGSKIPGVPTEGEADLLVARGTLTTVAAGASDALQDLNTTLAGLEKSPALNEFNRDFQEFQQELARAGSQTQQIINQRLPQLRRDLFKIETRLRVEGRSADAERLHIDLDHLVASAASPAPSPRR
jgi:ABC-type transporter Mla subunit MlaD